MDVKEYFGKIVVGTCEHQECWNHSFLPGQYGEIEHINLKHDPMTGRSRGFAFIVFKVGTKVFRLSSANVASNCSIV